MMCLIFLFTNILGCCILIEEIIEWLTFHRLNLMLADDILTSFFFPENNVTHHSKKRF